MKRIFLDTNVLIDYYDNRSGADAAESIFAAGYAKKIELYTSVLSFANFAYIAFRHRTREQLYAHLDSLSEMVSALPIDNEQLRRAIDAKERDFEDMLQYQCAIAAGCDAIVTRNIKDFQNYCTLPLMTSEDFVKSKFMK